MHFKTKNTPAVNRHVQRSKKFQTTRYHLTRFSSINVRTAGKQSTLAQHVITIKELGHDIACLQETRIPGQGGVVFEEEALKGWKVFHNGVKTAKHGVGIVTAPHVDIKDVAHHLDGRIMSLRVVIHGVKVTVVCCYGPTEEYAVSTKEAFYNTLQKTISSLKAQNPSYKLFLGGDFNASIGHDAVPANWACLGNNNDDCKTSTNGRKLIELCEANELRLTNTMFDTKTDQHRWSFKSNLGYYRRLDYVAVDGFLRRYVKNSRVYPTRSEAFESDHRAVVATLYLPSRSKRRQTFKSREKSPIKNFDCRFLRDDEPTREKYAQKLDEYLESCNRDEDFVDNIETMITSAIQSASAETIPVVQADRLAKPWQNEEYLNLIQARKNEKDEQRRRELGKLIKNMRFKLENEYFKAKADEINLASEARSTEEEFRLAKSFTSLNRVDKPLVSKQALEDHFAKHFSQREVEKPPEIINPEAFEHILPPPTFPPSMSQHRTRQRSNG